MNKKNLVVACVILCVLASGLLGDEVGFAFFGKGQWVFVIVSGVVRHVTYYYFFSPKGPEKCARK